MVAVMRSLSVIGLLLNLAGLACALLAFQGTWQQGAQESEMGHIWPWWYDTRRATWLWVQQHLGRRRDRTVHLVSAADVAVAADIAASVIVTGGPINEGDPLHGQIKAVDHRVELVERALADERTERDRQVNRLSQDTQQHFERLRVGDAEVRKLALGLTLGTVRLQMIGVVLLAVGTIVGSIPVVFG
jgi:hypothetical protein